jgi:hypothetical protein
VTGEEPPSYEAISTSSSLLNWRSERRLTRELEREEVIEAVEQRTAGTPNVCWLTLSGMKRPRWKPRLGWRSGEEGSSLLSSSVCSALYDLEEREDDGKEFEAGRPKPCEG